MKMVARSINVWEEEEEAEPEPEEEKKVGEMMQDTNWKRRLDDDAFVSLSCFQRAFSFFGWLADDGADGPTSFASGTDSQTDRQSDNHTITFIHSFSHCTLLQTPKTTPDASPPHSPPSLSALQHCNTATPSGIPAIQPNGRVNELSKETPPPSLGPFPCISSFFSFSCD